MTLESKIKSILKSDSIKLSPVRGGDINEAYKIKTESGEYFLKLNSVDWARDMYLAEKKGLELLSQSGILVPSPISVFSYEDGAGLIMEWMDRGGQSQSSWEEFGQSLAKLHHSTSDNFGLDHDNYIGRLPQHNPYSKDWIEFYTLNRLESQIKLAIDSGLMSRKSIQFCESAITQFEKGLPEIKPSLLHGDLWSGNLMFSQIGRPVFIDPAVYYGHREMDIAMMKLFGGFSGGFEIYQDIFPLDPAWEERLQFYQLYYLLVHVNLFGGSYISSSMRILEYYGGRK